MMEWFYCLIEIKGNFYINVGIRNGRVFVQPIFTLTMKKEDLKVLKMLRDKIGVGEIKISKKVVFIIRGIKNLQKFVEKINEENFLTSKKEDFIMWKEAIELIKNFKHLTKEGFLKICEIRDRMNLRKKRENYKDKKYLESLINKMKVNFDNTEKRRKISSSLRITYSMTS